MVLVVVSIYDRAVQAFGRPVFVASTGSAIRSFSDEINRKDADNVMARHPGDHELFQLATFDDSDGSFTPVHAQLALGRQVAVSS